MAGLRACLLALALTTSNGFAPAAQTGAARGRPSPKSHWRLRSEHFQRVDAAARHRFVQMKLCARLRRAGPSRGGRFHAGAPPCLDGVAARHRRAVRATGVRTKTPSTRPRAGQVAVHGYVPSGMSPEAYAAMKKKEEADRKKKQFGKGGARGFESRSMQSFVAGLEKGETKHLFPVNPEKVRKGEIALKDVPYMQRGGSWTNSDLTQKKKGWMNTGFGMNAYNDGKAKAQKANKYDAKYNAVKPSVGIFGDAGALDWTGRGARTGGGAQAGTRDGVVARAKANGLSRDQQMWRDAGALSQKQINAQKRWGGAPKIDVNGAKKPEKKFFGLF